MWIKTRVGLVWLAKPVDVMASNYVRRGQKFWWVHARQRGAPENYLRILLGQCDAPSTYSFLAGFADGEGARQAISECMEAIATAAQNGDALCDLSRTGDAQAWGDEWVQIAWK